MYSTGGDFRGALYVERLDTLPIFKKNRDLGRLLLVKNKCSYIGTDTGWAPCNLSDGIITANYLSLGFDDNQINASLIPATLNNRQSNIQDVLDCLKIHISNLEQNDGYFRCKKSFLEEIVEDILYKLENQRVIGHKDIEGNYGRSGEYLSTNGNIDSSLLPLKFKKIEANEIQVNIERPQCIKHYINKDIPVITNLQDVINMIILCLHYIYYNKLPTP